jgi:predicted NUDIX family NTP pyrophosphohydrolase
METIRGVGLIVIAGNTGKILTVKELEDKPVIKKRAGMRSFPEETVRRNESIADAMQRLMIEEIGVTINRDINYFIQDKVVVSDLPQVLMSVGFIQVPMEFDVIPVDIDIIFGGWHTVEEMLSGKILTRIETGPILEVYKSCTKK